MFHRVVRVFVIALVSVCALSIALAAEPAWTYIEAGYLNVDPDNISGSSGDNWFAGGSLQFFKNFHASVRYINGDFAQDTSQKLYSGALGWHGLLGEKADLFAEATYTDWTIDDLNFDDNGVGANVGLRWRPADLFELDGIVHWTDYSDFDSKDSYEVRAIFNVWKIGLGAGAYFNSDFTTYNAFARFNFGGK